MLPNWLYGKSKSKLATILGGSGGTPADYDEVKAQVTQNAEDIELLSDTLDTKAALTQITNPNILHNPWFQVNQRGATTISSSGYLVDRWYLSPTTTGTTTFTLNSDGTITIDNSLGEANAYFVQRRTTKTISRITARKVTLSIMLSDGTIHSGTGTFSGTETTTYYNDENFILQSSPQSAQLFTLRVKAGKSITIKAIKLELGSVSTLAMDTAPDMATELLKCQRYYQKFTSGPSESLILGLGVADTATTGICTISLPSAMRATPTLRLPNTFSVVVYASGATIIGSSLVINNLERNILQLNATWSENITAGQVIGIQLLNTAYIALDAEL